MKYYIFGGMLLFLAAACKPDGNDAITWKSMEKDLQRQLITAEDGSVIELPEGHFIFTRTLSLDGKSNLTIRGKGMDKTILSWASQTEGAEGMRVSNGTNITLEDFSIEDAKGDNLKVNDTRGIIMRRIRSVWTRGPHPENGAYGLYPVLCTNVLMEECMVIGSSDAGIYVGQSDSVVIRNNKAFQNVAGIESENSKYVEIYGNEAYENTGGILVFDLPGLTTYGHSTKVYNNMVRSNNHKNFAQKGNIVASIPAGTGMMILATRDIEVYDNDIAHNKSVGIAMVSYELVAALNEGVEEQGNAIGGVQTVNNQYREDTLYNAFPRNVSIYGNRFSNKHLFPSLKHDMGKLLMMKSLLNPPDVVYDGIADPKNPKRNICIGDNGKITFINLDAGNDFKGLSKNLSPFRCSEK